MIQIIAPIIAVVIAVGAFFGYINPTYEDVQTIQADIDEYNEALEKSRELQEIIDELLIKYNEFEDQDIERLEKFLPNNVDSVRLIIDIDAIASRYGLTIRDFGLSDSSASRDESPIASNNLTQTMDLSFKVTASYENFIAFLRDMENSLRLVDVTNVSFTSSDINLYEYEVTLRTYWLKSNQNE